MTDATDTTITADNSDAIIPTIIAAVKPHFGAFDIETGAAWNELRASIAEWLTNGDWSEPVTVEQAIADTRAEFADELAALRDGYANPE